jgi:predicted helicase
VSINLFIKTGKKKPNELGKVFHYDLFGKREFKYDFLAENSIKTIPYKELPNVAPNYFMVQKDFEVKKQYDEGFAVNELFYLNNVGIVTARDNFTIHNSKENLIKTIETFLSLDDETARNKFNLGKDVRDWQVNFARKDLKNNYPEIGKITKITYRPFDDKFTFYTGNSKGFHCYPRNEVMQHFLKGENVGLTLCKQFKTGDNYLHAFITNKIIESSYVSNRTSEITSVFPLYLYPDEKSKDLFATGAARVPNLNMEIVAQIAEKLGLAFVAEKHSPPLEGCLQGGVVHHTTLHNTPRPTDTPLKEGNYSEDVSIAQSFAPIDILDYIYAVLHSPSYREKYKEFLKIDFPRVPYPKDLQGFRNLAGLGAALRQIHLLESPIVEKYITQYPIDGNNVVGKLFYEKKSETLGRVYINYEKAPPSGVGGLQYFDNVPQVAWEFYIGGYQPAQKWLKDRQLSFEDILHYQKIIVALTETDRLMKEIDKIEIE